jgi:hypothetical protein
MRKEVGGEGPILFRMSFVHYRSGKRIVSKGRPFPIRPKRRKK